MSRDGWKSKYKDLKATVKGYKNRLAHLAKSREQWRIRAERAVDRGSRGIRDQPRNSPKYTEKRIRINFPFPCPSVSRGYPFVALVNRRRQLGAICSNGATCTRSSSRPPR